MSRPNEDPWLMIGDLQRLAGEQDIVMQATIDKLQRRGASPEMIEEMEAHRRRLLVNRSMFSLEAARFIRDNEAAADIVSLSDRRRPQLRALKGGLQ